MPISFTTRAWRRVDYVRVTTGLPDEAGLLFEEVHEGQCGHVRMTRGWGRYSTAPDRTCPPKYDVASTAWSLEGRGQIRSEEALPPKVTTDVGNPSRG